LVKDAGGGFHLVGVTQRRVMAGGAGDLVVRRDHGVEVKLFAQHHLFFGERVFRGHRRGAVQSKGHLDENSVTGDLLAGGRINRIHFPFVPELLQVVPGFRFAGISRDENHRHLFAEGRHFRRVRQCGCRLGNLCRRGVAISRERFDSRQGAKSQGQAMGDG